MHTYRAILRRGRARAWLAAWMLSAGLAMTAARVPPVQAAGDAVLHLQSSAFAPGGAIPVRYTCDGAERSPSLAWQGVPPGTRSLALVVADPDAPDPKAPQVTWIHWVLYDIPARVQGLEAGAGASAGANVGARSGVNSWHRTGYGGMCPPVGRHRYFFRLYALDTALTGLDRPDADELRTAMQGHVLGEAVLMGTYAHGQ